jgi:hypothetical protein
MSLTKTIFQTRIPFITIAPNGFVVETQRHESIDIHIHSFSFIRKLFSDNRIACYSLDAQTGKDGHQCCLCDWSYRCNKVIRLKIMVQNTPMPTPAMLDVNDHSFPSIEKILEGIPPEELHRTLITATINTASRLKIDFDAKF